MASFTALRTYFLLFSFISLRAIGIETLYSKLPVPSECNSDYQKGSDLLAQLTSQGFDLGDQNKTIAKLDIALAFNRVLRNKSFTAARIAL